MFEVQISFFSICVYYFPKYKTDLYKYRYLWTILETHLITFRAWLLGSAPISYSVHHMTDQSKSGTWMSWHTSKHCEYTIKDNIHVDTYLTEKMSLCSLMFVWNLFTLCKHLANLTSLEIHVLYYMCKLLSRIDWESIMIFIVLHMEQLCSNQIK